MKPTKVIKRDGSIVPFNPEKIERAILKAMKYGSGIVDEGIAKDISVSFDASSLTVPISEIEDYVYDALILYDHALTAKTYESYRSVRAYQRQKGTIDNKIWGIVNGWNSDIKDNSNKNPALISTMRDLVAEEVSKDISLRMMLPPHIAQAHNEGILYIHDLGHYLNPSFNCQLLDLENMLQNGTVINGKMVEKPHSFRTACTIATQIVAQVASGQFGGQTITLGHLAPFVRVSKEKFIRETKSDWDSHGFNYSQEQLMETVNKLLKAEVKAGIQTFQYQINTLQTSNGQAPFLSVFMYISEYPEYEEETVMLIKEMLEQRIQGMKNEVGVWVTPAFPKLLYVTDENNIYPDSKYYWLTQLAAKCVVNRMMPDFVSAKIMKENYEGNVFPCMGCRAWLSPYKGYINNPSGEYKWYGRFNMGVTSINLADAGLSARKNLDDFWKILNDRLDQCKESLLLRADKLKSVTSDVSPIHWQYGAIARLKKHEPIYPLLQDGYSTISLGYVGLYECVLALIGKSHTTPEGKELALKIMRTLKAATEKWKEETGLGFALYGTPAESLAGRFCELTRKRWGIVKGITDKDYFTNSYHVFVGEDINAFDKLLFESEFQQISSGGAISYVELPSMKHNIAAIENLIRFMYDNIQYAEINLKLDYCQKCGYEGEMQLKDNLQWYCPNCNNEDETTMNIVRRTCGYLGENLWGHGRTAEINERKLHL